MHSPCSPPLSRLLVETLSPLYPFLLLWIKFPAQSNRLVSSMLHIHFRFIFFSRRVCVDMDLRTMKNTRNKVIRWTLGNL